MELFGVYAYLLSHLKNDLFTSLSILDGLLFNPHNTENNNSTLI